MQLFLSLWMFTLIKSGQLFFSHQKETPGNTENYSHFVVSSLQLVEMLDMSVPAVAKLRHLLDNLPREALPDVLTSIIRTTNQEKLQVLYSSALNFQGNQGFSTYSSVHY